MTVSRYCLPRRSFLRGVDATWAMPLLDGMIPAFAAAPTAASPVPARTYTPRANLQLTLPNTLGVPVDNLGDGTGQLQLVPGVDVDSAPESEGTS